MLVLLRSAPYSDGACARASCPFLRSAPRCNPGNGGAQASSLASSEPKHRRAAPNAFGKCDDWTAADAGRGRSDRVLRLRLSDELRPATRGPRRRPVLTVTERPAGRDAVAIQRRFRVSRQRGGQPAGGPGLVAFYTAGRSAFARDGAAVARDAQGSAGGHALARAAGGAGHRHVRPARLHRPTRRSPRRVPPDERRFDARRAQRSRAGPHPRKAALFAPPPARLGDGRRDLVGLSRAELAAELAAIGEQPFRAKQLWHWIYHQGVTDFAPHVLDRPAAAARAGRAFRHRPSGGGASADQRG